MDRGEQLQEAAHETPGDAQVAGEGSASSGKNWFVRHKVLTGIGAVLLFFIGIGTLSGDPDTSQQATTGSREQATSQSPTQGSQNTASSAAKPAPPPMAKPAAPPVVTPQDRILAAVREELGSSNRGVKPRVVVSAIGKAGTPITVKWASNENLTEGLTKDTLRREAADILKATRGSAKYNYSQVILVGTYSMVDRFGKTTESQVVRANFNRATVERINFDGFNFKDVFDIADSSVVHPAFWY